MNRLKFLLLRILRKMGQSRRSKHQNTARNEHYIMAKLGRFYRGLQRILRVKNWRRSENFDEVGILRICGVTARSHIRLPTSTFTSYTSRQARFCMREISTLPPCYQGYTEASLSKKYRNYLPKPRFLIYPIQINSNMRVVSCPSHFLSSAFFFIALSTSPASKPWALIRIL